MRFPSTGKAVSANDVVRILFQSLMYKNRLVASCCHVVTLTQLTVTTHVASNTRAVVCVDTIDAGGSVLTWQAHTVVYDYTLHTSIGNSGHNYSQKQHAHLTNKVWITSYSLSSVISLAINYSTWILCVCNKSLISSASALWTLIWVSVSACSVYFLNKFHVISLVLLLL